MVAKSDENVGAPPQGVRDYIEHMLDELAELAGASGEARLAATLRLAALEVSRLELAG